MDLVLLVALYFTIGVFFSWVKTGVKPSRELLIWPYYVYKLIAVVVKKAIGK
jgi:hypothetical protein